MENQLNPTLDTIASYNNFAQSFAEQTRTVDNYPGLKTELDLFIKLLQGKKVLDVGFGSGRDTLYFQQHNLATFSIELCANFVKSFQNIVSSPIMLMDMRELAFRQQYFDGIWTCASLLHIPKIDVPSVLNGFNRVLKDDGLLYVSVKEGSGEQWIEEGPIKSPRYFSHYFLDEISLLDE